MLKLNSVHQDLQLGGEPQLLRHLCEEWLEAIKRGEVPLALNDNRVRNQAAV